MMSRRGFMVGAAAAASLLAGCAFGRKETEVNPQVDQPALEEKLRAVPGVVRVDGKVIGPNYPEKAWIVENLTCTADTDQRGAEAIYGQAAAIVARYYPTDKATDAWELHLGVGNGTVRANGAVVGVDYPKSPNLGQIRDFYHLR